MQADHLQDEFDDRFVSFVRAGFRFSSPERLSSPGAYISVDLRGAPLETVANSFEICYGIVRIPVAQHFFIQRPPRVKVLL